MTDRDGPDFGPLSRPHTHAVRQLLHPEEAAQQVDDPRLVYDLTDTRHAMRFAEAFGNELKFDTRRNGWRHFDGNRWALNDSAAVEKAAHFARLRQQDALEIPDKGTRLSAVSFAIRCEGRTAIESVLSLARHFAPMRDDREWIPIRGCSAVRMARSIYGPASCARPTERPHHVEYDRRGGRRRDRAALGAVRPKIPNRDAELVTFVQKGVGYSLTGETSEQVAFVDVGPGANGKTTFLSTLSTILGDYAYTMPFATVERQRAGGIPNDVAALAGKRFVTASEVNEGARWNEARLKALTGCDQIPARFLHAEFFTFRPVAKFWFAVNTKPQAHDHSHGFWRRLRLIPFPCTFPIDKKLSAALMAEAAGILAWAVRGCLRWQLDGLQAPAIVTTTTDEYREDSDPLSEFLRAACVIGDTVADSEMSASDLYKHYRDWAQRNSLSEREMLTATSFGTLIKNHLAWRRGRAGLIYTGVARSV